MGRQQLKFLPRADEVFLQPRLIIRRLRLKLALWVTRINFCFSPQLLIKLRMYAWSSSSIPNSIRLIQSPLMFFSTIACVPEGMGIV